MTEPTQAQIEAALDAFNNADKIRMGMQRDLRICLKAALTAAAQVDPTSGDPRWRDIAGQGIQTEYELRKQMLTLEAATTVYMKKVTQMTDRTAQILALLERIESYLKNKKVPRQNIITYVQQAKAAAREAR